jgi:hypothetical protein
MNGLCEFTERKPQMISPAAIHLGVSEVFALNYRSISITCNKTHFFMFQYKSLFYYKIKKKLCWKIIINHSQSKQSVQCFQLFEVSERQVEA